MADTAVSEKLLPPVFGKERKTTEYSQATTPNTVLAFLFLPSFPDGLSLHAKGCL
jgi:hypothetical protein